MMCISEIQPEPAKSEKKGIMKNPMVKFGLCGLLFFFMLFSCKEKIITIPDNIIQKDSMAAIMTDVQLLEAMKIKTNITDSFLKDSFLFQYALIFKKHHISQVQFEQSLEFYRSNPVLLEEIYEMTINEISAMQAILGAYNSALADSIKREQAMPTPLRLAKEAFMWKEEQRKEAEAKKSKTIKTEKDLPANNQEVPQEKKEGEFDGK